MDTTTLSTPPETESDQARTRKTLSYPVRNPGLWSHSLCSSRTTSGVVEGPTLGNPTPDSSTPTPRGGQDPDDRRRGSCRRFWCLDWVSYKGKRVRPAYGCGNRRPQRVERSCRGPTRACGTRPAGPGGSIERRSASLRTTRHASPSTKRSAARGVRVGAPRPVEGTTIRRWTAPGVGSGLLPLSCAHGPGAPGSAREGGPRPAPTPGVELLRAQPERVQERALHEGPVRLCPRPEQVGDVGEYRRRRLERFLGERLVVRTPTGRPRAGASQSRPTSREPLTVDLSHPAREWRVLGSGNEEDVPVNPPPVHNIVPSIPEDSVVCGPAPVSSTPVHSVHRCPHLTPEHRWLRRSHT